MASLYEINNEIEQAVSAMLASMDEETGEVDESLVNVLEDLKLQKSEKIDNIGAYIKNLLAEAQMLKAEEEALKARRESKEKKADSLKNYLATVLDGEKFESTRIACSWRKSEAVEVDSVDNLPDDYKVVKTNVTADKTKIKQAIKAGTEIAGARIIVKNNLQIK